jgi:hypothetical protein
MRLAVSYMIGGMIREIRAMKKKIKNRYTVTTETARGIFFEVK